MWNLWRSLNSCILYSPGKNGKNKAVYCLEKTVFAVNLIKVKNGRSKQLQNFRRNEL